LSIRHVLLTHAHVDHITGVATAKRALGVPVYLHHDDQFLYENAVGMGAMFGLRVEQPPPVDVFYAPGQCVAFGTIEARWHHTPGHCPGGVCLEVGRAGARGADLFVGDTLFAGSIGRTDLPAVTRRRSSRRSATCCFPSATMPGCIQATARPRRLAGSAEPTRICRSPSPWSLASSP
jgi:glyoxylase-like metal-dependent hydrolase (beta-lactamase superfamily II)